MNRRGDSGMTLIELMISVGLVTVVMGALVTALMLVYDTTASTTQKVTDSTGAQLVTSWLVNDAQSADTVQPSPGCPVATGTKILELQWTDAKLANGIVDVQYVAQDAGNGNLQLARVAYNVDSAGACTTANTDVLVRAIASLSATPPNGPGAAVVCVPASCTNPSEVGLDITSLSKDPHTGNYDPYTYEVVGYRRTQ